MVKESNLIDQSTTKFPEVNQLIIWITSVSFSPKKEKNKIQDRIAEINKKEVVIIWDILKLKFFPKKKQNKKLIRGRKITKWAIKIALSF